MYSDLPPHWCRSTAQTRCSGATWSGQRAELPSRRCGSRSRVGSKHFRCPRQRIVSTQKNQYNTDTNTIHFRKKILAKLEEGQSIRAVAQHFEIDKNTIVEWKKRIEIKRTRPRKPSKVDDDALRADVEQYPDDYQYERAARFGCGTSTIGDALKRLNITVKKRPYGTRKQKQNSESRI